MVLNLLPKFCLLAALLTAIMAVFIVPYLVPTGPEYDVDTLSTDLTKEYDYIVVGAGSAGSVLAARLSERKDVSVLVLEAGEDDQSYILNRIPALATFMQLSDANWGYEFEPSSRENGMKGNRMRHPRGRILGGTSQLNYMIVTRGVKRDFDDWSRNHNLTGWSYEEVLPYFKKLEDVKDAELAKSPGRGVGGPLPVNRVDSVKTPAGVYELFLNASVATGLPRVDDYNNGDNHGVTYAQVNIENGERMSASRAFLRPAMVRENLHVATGAHALKVLVEKKVARGVRVRRGGAEFDVKARKEVIVCAGTISTPQLLQLSGIGPRQVLEDHGVDVVVDSPNVGAGMQDHPVLLLPFDIASTYANGLWEVLKGLFLYPWAKSGVLSSTSVDAFSFFRLAEVLNGEAHHSDDIPEVQLHTMALPLAGPLWEILGKKAEEAAPTHGLNKFILIPTMLHPHSKGDVMIRSSDPMVHPRITYSFFDDNKDRATMRAILKYIYEKLLATAELSEVIQGPEVFASCMKEEPGTEAFYDCLIDYQGSHCYHPVGTVKMGGASSAPLDARLRVRGVKGLRVADGSVFPEITSGNTAVPIMMVAEKAAHMILEDNTK